ncbi:uncharacterized protein LOC133312630 [Gastrolobium bilobum]|uniref:uncharacterized protein LOC133312630 n=1 Tax=Gastrolobium bilobum TaxID=150636 RepID=UPI002AB079FA|nr:uncharacterized protein LOC133312630 [Gastrolobium bilobum]
MEGSLSEEAQKVESLSEDKEVSVEVDADDGISKSLSDEHATQSEENSGLVESGKVEETQDVSEEPNDFSDLIKAAQVDNIMVSDTVELELKEDQGKDFQSPEDTGGIFSDHGVKETELPPSEDNNELSSVSRNEGLQETEEVETVNDLTVAEEEKNDLSSVVTEGLLKEGEEPNEIYNFSSQPPTDVVSKETQEASIPKSDESDKVPLTITGEVPKGIERSLVPSMVEKDEEHLDAQESSYETAKDSFQPSANVTDDESTSATVKNQTEAPRSTENPTIVPPVTQRQYTSWKSCCGLFEILSRGDR